jgi:hypothetical protein
MSASQRHRNPALLAASAGDRNADVILHRRRRARHHGRCVNQGMWLLEQDADPPLSAGLLCSNSAACIGRKNDFVALPSSGCVRSAPWTGYLPF